MMYVASVEEFHPVAICRFFGGGSNITFYTAENFDENILE